MAHGARRRPLSLVLYGGVGVRTPELERRFFSRLRLPNGTWRSTYAHRLDDLNDALLPFMPHDRPARLMDVAVSSGVSTIEWSEQLSGRGVSHSLVAGDICTQGWLTSWSTGFAVIFDETQRIPLLIEAGPISLPVQSERTLARLVRPLLVPALRALARLGRTMGPASPMAPAMRRRLVHRPIPLVTPELLRHTSITVVQDDVAATGAFAGAFDVVRVANLLHRAYFDDAALERMSRNLGARLRDGGILAICRTMDDGRNDATLFRLVGGRFTAVGSLNAGAEIADLVLGQCLAVAGQT